MDPTFPEQTFWTSFHALSDNYGLDIHTHFFASRDQLLSLTL